jgi:pimeloyl-ACP methyl ester carboxylesterase
MDLQVDLTGKTELPGTLHTAVTVHCPSTLSKRPVVIFAFPGGGYGKGYFDAQVPGATGYSQAEHHAAEGHIVVACDHVGVGASSELDRSAASYENVAAANAATVNEVLRLLREGTVAPALRKVVDPITIGMGQSYGGMLLIVQQGRQRSFDGVAVLGYSGTQIRLPEPIAGTAPDGGTLNLAELTPRDRLRYAFYWEDVPAAIIDGDLKGTMPKRTPPLPMWASDRRPGGAHWSPHIPGVVAHWAAVIECPVFIGCGERDVCPDPWSEPAAYRRSKDITLAVIPRMAHMHNFAGTRNMLWERLSSWMNGIAHNRKSLSGREGASHG